MKATADSIPDSASIGRPWTGVLADLTKARLTFLVLVTTLVGFYMGLQGPVDYWLLFHTMVGTALVASGAAALNQFTERDLDARMRRTEKRPLPAGELTPESVLIGGSLISALGLVYLAVGVNGLTSLLGALSLISYLFVYTPLKRVTPLNTAVGAIPGALPPLMGWTAARGELAPEGWALFAILFFWQLPHFLAIAWIYREEYAKAGFKMLPVVDPLGVRTARQAITHTIGLLAISCCPLLFQMAGWIYFVGAMMLGITFLWGAIQFARHLNVAKARLLFHLSIVYLPLTLVLMVLDKMK